MLVNVYIRRAKSHILVYIRRAKTHILQNMTVCPRANSHILIILLVFAFQNLSKSHFWTNYARIFSHNCIGKKKWAGYKQQHMNEMMLFQQQQRQLTGSDFMQPINTASNQNLTNNYQIGNLNLTQNKRQIKKDA